MAKTRLQAGAAIYTSEVPESPIGGWPGQVGKPITWVPGRHRVRPPATPCRLPGQAPPRRLPEGQAQIVDPGA